MRLLSAYRPWLGTLAFLLSIPLCPQLLAAPPHCWVVTETRHVLRSESPGEWREARLSIARNEWGSFQVLVRADAPISGLRLEAGDLKGSDNHPAEAIRLVLYRQHQLFLDTGTHRNADFKPDGYPDPLIPFDHPVAALRRFIERYRVNAVQILHPSRVVKDPEAERDRLRAWLAAFDIAARQKDNG